ncbi:MAG: MBL fold metallo-hydrolase [Chlamydiae bacterium]|nr:MBL fold metallo-hydrolase [Chlamydiota bacterium]
MTRSFLFLGTGGSMGVPVVTCSCKVCTSPSPYNKRLRPSGLVKWDGKQILIDAGPDFREQALRFNIRHLDGILLTHTHYDHIGGIDDLRVFYFLKKMRVHCLSSKETSDELKYRYHYLFRHAEEEKDIVFQLDLETLPDDFGKTHFMSIPIQYVTYFQAGMKVNGFRFGSFAYISDIQKYDVQIFPYLEGLDILVVSALRETPSPAHFTLEEAISFARKVGAKKTYITHIAHNLEHEETNRKLPKDIRLAYDGLEITIL